ncbi:MAG: exo-alpha-sialidase [Actinobacteria bacterium]|nr:exo-alpha-sialidase [Actinomycetota bacterium]
MNSRMRGAALIVAIAGLGLVGCSSQTDAGSGSPSIPESGPVASKTTLSEPLTHLHGAAVDDVGDLFAATHDGVWKVADNGGVSLAGTSRDDFMGFAITSAAGWFGSGHPGAGSDMVNPMGLIASTDTGKTWSAISRVGETDFHSLAATNSLIVGFDGRQLLRSADGGGSWEVAKAAVSPASLALLESDLLATTEAGLMRSSDEGDTFELVADAPAGLVLLSARASALWGLDTQERMWVSLDSGTTWSQCGSAPGAQAIAAVDDGSAFAISESHVLEVAESK